MTVHAELRIYALGPVQIFQGERALTSWNYLESKELLFYLLCHTQKPQSATAEPRGRTREQLGRDLWPNATPSQLSANLKSRLYDLRQTLGGGDWIVFRNAQYLFNHSLNIWFDVEVFERKTAEARSLTARVPAQAIARYQEAIQLYRGDFLEDLRKGRARRSARSRADPADEREREWYLEQQAELREEYQQSLGDLGRLLFAAGRYEEAVEIYRKAVAQDDYDDESHRELMRCYAYQGKRSRALQHYRELCKRRADTPPEPDIVELAERLRRGEEVVPKPPTSATMDSLDSVIGVKTDQKPSAPFQAPADLTRFVGREPELSELRATLANITEHHIYCLVGMGGIGKTTLAIHLAHALRADFPDGVLWAHVSTSEPMAILDSWARAYQCDFSALPDLDSRAAALRSILADKKVLLILDDVWDTARARALLLGGPHASVLLTTRDLDIAVALDAQAISLSVLAAQESHQLLSRILGDARVMAEQSAADELCELVGHLPLALEISAHRLASRPRWSLSEMVDRLRDQRRRLSELKMGDQEVRASFAVSWAALEEQLCGTFALLSVFEGRAFTPAALAAVAEMNERAASDNLDALAALSLVSVEDEAHYRQHPLLADFAREHLEQSEAADKRMAQYYLSYASAQRQDYLALEGEWDNLSAGLRVANQQQLWQVVIDYGDVLSNAWFARGRFSDARQSYPRVCEAAKELEEQDAYIAAMLNWGKACIDQGDYAEAWEHLSQGLQVCREVDDQYSAATAQFLLARVSVEKSDYEEAQRLLAESQRTRERLNDRAGLAETLYMQARIRYRFQDYAEAERLGKQALDIQQKMPSNRAGIVTLRLLAVAAAAQGNYELAETYGQRALAMCEELQDRGEQEATLYNMSVIVRLRGKLNFARDYAEKSLKLNSLIGDRKGQAMILHQLSKVAADLKEYDVALQHGFDGLKILRELKDALGMAGLLLHLGDIFKQLDKLEEACQMWSEALPLAEKLQHPFTTSLRERLDGSCAQVHT